jgi:hypothetical protein
LLASETLEPPAGAAALNVTVQVLTPPGLRLVGLQVSAETSTGAVRLIVAVLELLPKVAVTIAL